MLRLNGVRAVWPGLHGGSTATRVAEIRRQRCGCMKELALTRMRYGYRKIGTLLKREGFPHSIGMLYRVYREEGLSLRYRPGRRCKAQVTRPQRNPVSWPNQAWSLDFVADQLSSGSRFRCLTIVDVFTRECLAIEVGQRLQGTATNSGVGYKKLGRSLLGRQLFRRPGV